MLKRSNNQGFTLLEVMVALVVLSVGLLGVVKLETVAYASTNIAARRSMAALQAASLAATMHVNRGYWASTDTSAASISITGTTFVVVGPTAPLLAAVVLPQNCANTAPCLPVNLAAYDVQNWALTMPALLPNYTATINCGTQSPVSCMINMTWNENTVGVSSQETGVLAAPSYTLYVEP